MDALNETMDKTPTHLDLFSGIGGFALAAQWAGFRTIGFCEIDKYCQKVLAKNFLADAKQSGISRRNQRGFSQNGQEIEELKNGSHPANESSDRSEIRIAPDIFNLDGRQFAGVSLITGGFPCQPFSVAGKRRGAADDRAIWPEMFRVISEARPAWVLGENVPGIIPMELDNVLSDLEGIGYATRAFVIPACAVDARHRRDRVWIVANAIDSPDRTERGSTTETDRISGINREALRGGMSCRASGEFSNAKRKGLEGHGNAQESDQEGWQNQSGHTWATGGSGSMADATGEGWRPARSTSETIREPGTLERFAGRGGSKWYKWLPEPAVCELVNGVSYRLVRYRGRTATGISNRVNKLKALGNAIVPQVAYEILKEIRKLI
jgi:DNA (cytosine-5)-methyltransferase 1